MIQPDMLSDLIGPGLASDLTMPQRVEVLHAAAESEEGLRRVVHDTLADFVAGRVENPTAILLSRIRRGRHRLAFAASPSPPRAGGRAFNENYNPVPASENEARARALATRIKERMPT